MPFVERNEFRPAGLDLEDLGAVTALPDEDARPGVAAVCDVLIACRHLRAPLRVAHDHKSFYPDICRAKGSTVS